MTPLGIGLCHIHILQPAPRSNIFKGVRRSWTRLLEGRCGIVSIKDKGPQFATLPSRIAGLVKEGRKDDGGWNAKEWLTPGVRFYV